MYKKMEISDKTIELARKAEENIQKEFKQVELVCEYNSLKVLKAFQKNNISDMHFNGTTGYGYGDIGRDTIERVFAEVLEAEDSLVRTQFISGTHALTVALFAYLRPGDIMLSISGKPYDTLDEVIGLVENDSSLKSYGVQYEQIELKDDDFDYEEIKNRVAKNDIKLIEIQRSRGYALRSSISLEKMEKVIKTVIPEKYLDENTKYYINPTGRFAIGGPLGDSGLTGRKIIVDTYGGYSRHGGGAFSGKDATKVDRSASYMARFIAKNIVANGYAKKCEIQLSYAIGIAKPISIYVDTFGTATIPEEEIVEKIKSNFDLTPKGIIKYLGLKKPIYKETTNYGHFGKENLAWEKIIKL